MKYIFFVIARVLLGLVFTVFGLNGFLHFFPSPPVPGLAGQFMGALLGSHYYVIAFGTEVIGGVLLLSKPLRAARTDAPRTGDREHP